MLVRLLAGTHHNFGNGVVVLPGEPMPPEAATLHNLGRLITLGQIVVVPATQTPGIATPPAAVRPISPPAVCTATFGLSTPQLIDATPMAPPVVESAPSVAMQDRAPAKRVTKGGRR